MNTTDRLTDDRRVFVAGIIACLYDGGCCALPPTLRSLLLPERTPWNFRWN